MVVIKAKATTKSTKPLVKALPGPAHAGLFITMPFTFSHPAIVLPFLRIRHPAVSMSALIVGSMIPDFQYFIRMRLSGRYSHTVEGLFLFDLPMAIVVLIVFHGVVKAPLIDNLPLTWGSRLQRLKEFNFWTYGRSHPIALICCILLGAVSHLVWDGFTHAHSLFTERISGLQMLVQGKYLPELPVFRYLQHISTALGAIGIIWVFYKMPSKPVESKPSVWFWIVMVLSSVIVFSIRWSYGGIGYYGNVIVVIISAMLIGLIIASLLARLKSSRT